MQHDLENTSVHEPWTSVVDISELAYIFSNWETDVQGLIEVRYLSFYLLPAPTHSMIYLLVCRESTSLGHTHRQTISVTCIWARCARRRCGTVALINSMIY